LLAVTWGVLGLAEDSVEFLNGTTLSGKILEIRKAAKEFDFQSSIAGQSVSKTYQYAAVHAVTFNGKRFVINEMQDTTNAVAADLAGTGKSEADVRAIIDGEGASEPDWLAATKFAHPKSLDLSWPLKVDGPWDESKNVGQYMWGRVNPNPSRWRSGIKLLHECVRLHSGKRELLKRDYSDLGNRYFVLLQDYSRAAYYFEKGQVAMSQPGGIHLAECYYRLGSKKMAMDLMRGKSLHFDAIKLLSEMGELKEALNVTKVYARTRVFNEAFLNAGDALRAAGRLDEAIDYYQQVLDRNEARDEEYLKRYRGRASDSINAIRLFDKADVSKVADGIYDDKAVGYNGDVHVRVKVANGQVEDVEITKHKEKQFYAALTDTPRQIIEKQSIQDIDGTSGATITSQAIVNASARALAQGAKN
ncbi:MAG: FMN-binding protein, partial [Pirellulaceae bacterium]